ncbi:MAG TPA: carbamoyltransferase HypF [Thermoanaerobaculia bacterium]|nr:carbamoyltransferase HypF [Thermoanaerobaculia bacterium]
MDRRGRRIEVRGTVQGVGFRPFVYQLAQRIGVSGRVWNDSRGVVIDAFGDAPSLEHFTDSLQSDAPPAARVRSVDWKAIPFAAFTGFAIDPSASSAEYRVSIPADMATCSECVGEIFDPTNRRYRYAFTNCTNCGPRYSIVHGAPYDRAKTSMSRFGMCDKCQGEYDDPLDRRFHAQPNACPMCGPRLAAVTPQRHEVTTSDPIDFAARAIRAGFIVALKGLGGFHLACDATSPQAIERLRERKHRDAKPLAIMVRDLVEAEKLAELTNEERDLLMSIERPIVLAKKRVVDDDNPLVGLFLPYTPLHHILLHDAGVPLVMTSGNVSDEPMVTTNSEAFKRLRHIADIFLVHDRDIVTRVDDSIARVIDGAPVILRRARGYVPRAIESGKEFAEPILACGAHLKNTFCIASGSNAYLGPHIGDLESVETLRAYESAIERMKEFVGASPAVIAHDMHPDYFSTRYALAQAGVRAIAVQHHHAHVVSAMAEHRLDGPVIGVAYDGTGYGTDGTAWGGEILIADYAKFERFATFRAIPLAGGDQAVRQPWRVALALLDEAFDGEPPLRALPLFRTIERHSIDAVRRMIARNFNSPLARGVGRYFDAFGAMFLGLPEMRYEGEVAFRWNVAADASERGHYPIVVHAGETPWEIDARPMVKAAVEDFIAGSAPSIISARFHNTIAQVTIEVARGAMESRGNMPLVLSGGCFQNAMLAESVIKGFSKVYMNRDVPPGDGGIALGQAFVASAVLRSQSSVVSEELVCA